MSKIEVEGKVIGFKANWEPLNRWGNIQVTITTENFPMSKLKKMIDEIRSLMYTHGKGTISMEEGHRFVKFTELR